MTTIIPKPGLADKILKLMGKKRGIIMPSSEYEKFGPYTYSIGKRESFFKALLRPANEPLPNGLVDIQTFISKNEIIDKASENDKA